MGCVFRANSLSTETGEGIGLNIVKRIAEKHTVISEWNPKKAVEGSFTLNCPEMSSQNNNHKGLSHK